MESQPLHVFIRLQESPNQFLDVAAASIKQPTFVRDALLKAIRLVQLRPIDLQLLQIEHELQNAFNSPWKKPTRLQHVLESCRRKSIKGTESLFYEEGGDFAVAMLGIATRYDVGLTTKHDGRRLLAEIDTLSNEEKTELIKNILWSTKKSVKEDIDRILKSLSGTAIECPVPEHFHRPRFQGNTDTSKKGLHPAHPRASKKKSNGTNKDTKKGATVDSLQRSGFSTPPTVTCRHNKRRRLEGGSVDHSQTPPEVTSSYGEKTSSLSLPPQPPAASNALYPCLPEHMELHSHLLEEAWPPQPAGTSHDPPLEPNWIPDEAINQMIMNAGGFEEFGWNLNQGQ